jgi:thiamine biosynthesis lipoprotein
MTGTVARGAPGLGSVTFAALGTTATLLVADAGPGRLAAARGVLEAELAAVDAACSRFRPDSELTMANRAAGRPVAVGELLAEAIEAALRAAQLTDGAVDPTVGAQMCALGYDRTFTDVLPRLRDPAATPAPGWRTIALDPSTRTLLVPEGTSVDLGATAKALAADRAAQRAAGAAGCGVLVNLGGDIRVAGQAPGEGWRIAVGDDHRRPGDPASTVALTCGALATSSIAVRSWRRGRRTVHHIVDPATGDNPAPVWRTVSVTAATCVDANTAATAAIVMGAAAVEWLTSAGLPARLVAVDGTVSQVAGWPADLVGDQGTPA